MDPPDSNSTISPSISIPPDRLAASASTARSGWRAARRRSRSTKLGGPSCAEPTHARLHLVMRLACYGPDVPKSVQIRDLDDEVYARLARRAAEAGVSVPELLRTEATRLAARPSVEEWLSRTRRRATAVGRLEVLTVLDEQRGSWPDAGS